MSTHEAKDIQVSNNADKYPLAMNHFSRIPSEVISNIVEHIFPDRLSCVRMASTCKDLKAVTIRALYRTDIANPECRAFVTATVFNDMNLVIALLDANRKLGEVYITLQPTASAFYSGIIYPSSRFSAITNAHIANGRNEVLQHLGNTFRPLHLAAVLGRVEITNLLLSVPGMPPESLNQTTSVRGNDHHWDVPGRTKFPCLYGINPAGFSQSTPLDISLAFGHYNLTRYLHSKSALTMYPKIRYYILLQAMHSRDLSFTHFLLDNFSISFEADRIAPRYYENFWKPSEPWLIAIRQLNVGVLKGIFKQGYNPQTVKSLTIACNFSARTGDATQFPHIPFNPAAIEKALYETVSFLLANKLYAAGELVPAFLSLEGDYKGVRGKTSFEYIIFDGVARLILHHIVANNLHLKGLGSNNPSSIFLADVFRVAALTHKWVSLDMLFILCKGPRCKYGRIIIAMFLQHWPHRIDIEKNHSAIWKCAPTKRQLDTLFGPHRSQYQPIVNLLTFYGISQIEVLRVIQYHHPNEKLEYLGGSVDVNLWGRWRMVQARTPFAAESTTGLKWRIPGRKIRSELGGPVYHIPSESLEISLWDILRLVRFPPCHRVFQM